MPRIRSNGWSFAEVVILLAVIASIAFGVFYGLDLFKKRAADSKRVSDIREIANALDEYHGRHGQYPIRLEDLVSDGRLLYIPTPAPYGASAFGNGTMRTYTYVPLGDSICTGYHLGAPLETKFDDYLLRDGDAKPARVCNGAATADFDGTAINCAPGELGVGAVNENCYDIKE